MAETFRVALGNTVNIASIEALYTMLEPALQNTVPVEIDAGEVERIDTAGLQLLCVMQKELLAQHSSLLWHNPSPSLASAAKLLGVHQYLKLSDQ